MAIMARLGRKMDGRILVVVGSLIFAYAMWLHSHFTTQSGYSDFLLPSILRGVGMGMLFVPLSILAMVLMVAMMSLLLWAMPGARRR